MNSFNKYFRKYFDYPETEEREILTEIYTNRNTGELCQMVTRLKHSVFKCKIHINTVLFGDKVLLLIEVVHLETVRPAMVKQLVKDLKKCIHSSNLKVVSQVVTLGDFEARRCYMFKPPELIKESETPHNKGLEGWI